MRGLPTYDGLEKAKLSRQIKVSESQKLGKGMDKRKEHRELEGWLMYDVLKVTHVLTSIKAHKTHTKLEPQCEPWSCSKAHRQ